MNKTDCKEWLVGLRSGEYPQGHGFLFNRGVYCCLGVYCAIKKIPGEEIKGTSMVVYTFSPENFDNATSLPPDILAKEFVDELISLNDERHKSFDEIADYIEKEILPTLED